MSALSLLVHDLLPIFACANCPVSFVNVIIVEIDYVKIVNSDLLFLFFFKIPGGKLAKSLTANKEILELLCGAENSV